MSSPPNTPTTPARLGDRITIEDDDGYTTTWPFPTGSSLLHQGDYITLCETMHNAGRAVLGETDQP